jgi:diguanylate cyclase (GGDEF)-like protein
MLLLHPFLFQLLVITPHALEWAKKRLTNSETLKAWYIQPFNIATHLIAGLVARWIYLILAVDTGLVSTPAHVFLVIVTALTYVGFNHLLIGLVLTLARNISLRQSKLLSPESLLPDVILASLGYVVVLLWRLDPWLLILALSPLISMYQALKVPQLKQEAQTDTKTGLLNARYFNKVFTEEFERARRFNRPLSFIMADLDLMRNINNTYGHLAGDAVLAGVGKVISHIVRDYDRAGRFGGEEFAIVLPEVSLLEARVIAERIRAQIEATGFVIPNCPNPIHATMSLGVSCFPHEGSSTTSLNHAADVAVYQAKQQGRNRVVCAADLSQEVLNDCVMTPVSSETTVTATSPAPEQTKP